MIIRVILIACVLAAALLALRGTGSARELAVRRLFMMIFSAAWIVAVIEPDVLTTIGKWVGVGRGTDLLLYALVVAVLLLSIGVHQRFTRLETRVNDLTRELALATAQGPQTHVTTEVEMAPVLELPPHH